MNLHLNELYFEYKEEVMVAIQFMKNEYPIIDKIIKRIYIGKMSVHFENCFATSKPLLSFHMKYEIKLNPIAFSNPGINEKIQNTYDSNYRSIKSIIYHEIGHVLQLFYICHIYKLDFRHVNYFRIVWLSTKHDTLMKKYFQSHNLSDDMILHYLGKSAFSDIWEVLPECYNNYYDFKVSEKPLNYFNSQAFSIVERIITDYKKYIPII